MSVIEFEVIRCKMTATRTSRPEATLPNADVAGAGTSAHTEVTDAAPRVTEGTPGPATVPRHRTVVLPKLQIPTFSGALRDWQTFWDHFSATIHRNEDLLPIEKFKYLLSYLSGAAKRAIEGVRLTEDNYAIAIRTLTERFGRRDLLINEHIDHLLALQPVKSSADVDKLRLLYDKVQFRVSALTGLGVSPDQYNVVLNRVLMRCLPDDLAILYRQKSKEAPQDTSGIATPEERARQVAQMLSFLRIQIEVREEGRPGRTPSAFSRLLPEEDVEPPSAPMEHLPTASALAAESVAATEEVCPLCSSCQHTIADCNVQLSAEEKRARLRTARCCYRCGLQNHMARFCRRARSIICSKCNRRHLTILCELFTPAAPTRANATTVSQDEPRITGRGTNTPSVTSAPSALSGINAVLLQTGRVWIECGSQKRLVRILLDSGSQRTFIRADVSKDLRCPVMGTEELSLVTFGHSKPREVMRSRRVALTLRGQRRDIVVTVEALEVPEVCAVTSPPLSTDILQLLCDKNYDAADNFHPYTWNAQEVSVLLGSDVYWKVATGKVNRLTSNLTAVETKFGWTVQGTTERERSSSPRCDRGGPPSQRRPFFRGCALQTARPPRYPRVLQGGSGGGFDGARGPRRGFGVRPPFHGNDDTSSRDYDHTRYGDCRGDAVDGPHSLPDRTQQGRPQWRQRGRSVTPPTQPGAWTENWRTRTSQGARNSNDRRGCWESRSFYSRCGSSDSETDRGRRHPSGDSGRETMMATLSSRARSRNVAAENSHRVAVRIAGESRELTRGAKAASRIASRARLECPREEDCCSKRPGDPQPLGARSHHDQTNEVSVKTSKVTDSVEPAAVVTSKATSLGAQAKGQTMDAARTPKCPRHTIKRSVQKVIHSGGKSAKFNCLVIALAPWEYVADDCGRAATSRRTKRRKKT
ncbi:hypothetical protein HPB52_012518 [Rhipicephalus sanguineus]|uniref:CCHC-type domain-containing protein n=1 Tax=Rhipicephalus sanguineus TaxID=34632 RepID=A0A9D4PST6_RHISA|nr:hypothetical protein HPB52_012518 [Rhipicephalus sanguineus]